MNPDLNPPVNPVNQQEYNMVASVLNDPNALPDMANLTMSGNTELRNVNAQDNFVRSTQALNPAEQREALAYLTEIINRNSTTNATQNAVNHSPGVTHASEFSPVPPPHGITNQPYATGTQGNSQSHNRAYTANSHYAQHESINPARPPTVHNQTFASQFAQFQSGGPGVSTNQWSHNPHHPADPAQSEIHAGAHNNRPEGQSAATQLPRRSIKYPEPKYFEGSRDQQKVEEFIFQAENYCEFYALHNQQAVTTMAGYFKGKAITWWRLHLQHNTAPVAFPELADLLRDKFIPKTAKRNLKDKMEKLRQFGSVTKFNTEFRDLLLEIPDLYKNEEDLIHKYLNKLKSKTRVEVEWKITDENSLEEIMDLAERYDNIVYNGNNNFVGVKRNFASSQATPMDIDNTVLNKLTENQRAFLVKNKGCFKCRKLGHFASECPSKPTVNNVETQTEEETVEEEYTRLFGYSPEDDSEENSEEATTS